MTAVTQGKAHAGQLESRAMEDAQQGLALEVCDRQASGIRNDCILYRIRIALRGTLLTYCDTSIVTL